MAKVAFIGLGVMGAPMARHLAKRGHDVTVYNRTAAKADRWVKENGGAKGMHERNEKKAQTLYGAIDTIPFYRCPVEKGSRSVMNVVFRLPNEPLEEKFVSEAKKQKMVGLKGHRSVGGIRASIYNAVSVEAVNQLASFMGDFAKHNG